jgi:hypothetical protein
MRLGMNLTPPVYWSDDLPTLDRMKCAGDWKPAASVLSVGADGWPTKIIGKVTCYLPMTDVLTPYIIRWKGKGKFNLGRNFKPTKSGDGWLTVTTAALPGEEKGSNSLNITEIDSADPLRDISVVELRYDARHQAGEILNPDFVDQLRGYGQIRFMDWMQTNGSGRTRALLHEEGRSFSRGVPLSVCLALAKAAGARAWVNMPAHITDASLVEAARLCPLGTDIEWSNEIWNHQFEQAKWAEEQAKAQCGSPAKWGDAPNC